jgi:hypothetical protein
LSVPGAFELLAFQALSSFERSRRFRAFSFPGAFKLLAFQALSSFERSRRFQAFSFADYFELAGRRSKQVSVLS